ncbi:MAG TPA: sigma-E factor regulatory protein RseB domain-containing protein [Spirochaetia bacterium]|nr:sigma-E factor regulatory protein RseB domain-containing protein [Spirochaetia bacterium]
MRLFAWSLPLAAFLLCSQAVRGEDLPPSVVYALLLKVARAPSIVSYQGNVEIEFRGSRADKTVFLAIDHSPGSPDKVTLLRPGSVGGQPPAQKQEGDFHGHDRNRLDFMGLPGARERLDSDLSLLLRNYDFTATNDGTIAGRAAYRLQIDPKYPGRKQKVLWVDNKTGIVLKSTVEHPTSGSTVTTFFTTINESPDNWSLPAGSGGKGDFPKPLQERETTVSSTPWKGVIAAADLTKLEEIGRSEHFLLLAPSYVPEGFVIEEVRELTPHDQPGLKVVHLLYSDGLSSISLFLQKEEPLWPDRIRRFFFGPGPHPLFRRDQPPDGVTVAEGSRDGTHYVLVSDVSGDIIKRMADSLSAVKYKVSQ